MPVPRRSEDGQLIPSWLLVVLSAMAGATVMLLPHWTWLRRKTNPRSRVVGSVSSPRMLGVIPARYESQRFPGKPLVDILGKPMVVRTWQQAKKAKTLDFVVVATDDERIASACKRAGADVVMTSSTCPNGTERCHEAATKMVEKYDIVINIQGDEPLIDPQIIDDCVQALQQAPDAVYSTACTPMDISEVALPHRVKVIVDANNYAIYFSRGPLPNNKTGKVRAFPEPFTDKAYLLHLGLACFDRHFLRKYCEMPATPCMSPHGVQAILQTITEAEGLLLLQLMEDLEQLKVIENGFRIKVIVTNHCAHGVDEPEDVDSIIAKMRELGLQ